MNKKCRLWLGAAIAATAIPLAASSSFAQHSNDIPLRDANGAVINDSITAYSPKMTCMAAGINDSGTGDMFDTTGCHTLEEYASAAKKTVSKTQGIIDATGEVVWQSYTVDAHAHGAVSGRHSQQGRNEDYSIAMKTAFKDAFFTSSPGMFGKY